MNLVEGMKQIVGLLSKQRAFSTINHPDWHWAYGSSEIADVGNADAFEVYNGALGCNNDGDDNNPSTDEIWDQLLSKGIRIYGIASDDAHDYNVPNPIYAEPPFNGWICVHAKTLSRDEILRSLFLGNFYASNHPILEHLGVKPDSISVTIKEIDHMRYTTRFVGRGGKLLRQVHGTEAVYTPAGTEGYVRAIITDTDGHKAWTQPHFL